MADDQRIRVLESTYACVADRGLAKTTVEDVAREAGISRATVYRLFPGGRDQVVHDMIAHETASFFLDLAAVVESCDTVTGVVAEALVHAHRAVEEHKVLQILLAHEPERLVPVVASEAARLLPQVAAFVEPYLRRARLRPGVDPVDAADYVARLVLSLINSPGRWDLADRSQVDELVRTEILGGVVDAG